MDAQRIPEPARKNALAKTDTVQQVATSLYLRRTFAGLARTEGIANDPSIQSAIRQSEEKILADAYLAKLDEKNKVSDAIIEKQAQAAYKADPKKFEAPEQVRARHILIKKDVESGKAKGEKLLSELKAGAKFEELAKQHSGDTGSASRGGDLGFFGKGQMVPAFEQAAFSLAKPGDTSGLVESPFGWHIIQLEQRRSAGPLPYDEIKDRLKAEISNRLINDARAKESQRLLEQVKMNRDAMESFSATFR